MFFKLAEGDQAFRLGGEDHRDDYLRPVIMTINPEAVFNLTSPRVRWCTREYLTSIIRTAFNHRSDGKYVCLKHMPPPEEGMKRYGTTGGLAIECGRILSWMTSFDEEGLHPEGIPTVQVVVGDCSYMIPVNEIVEFTYLD